MVDKIDRPERIPSYRIEGSKQATDEDSKRQSQQEQEHFVPQHEGEWQKFHSNTVSLQTQKVSVLRIAAVRFKSVMLRQGVPTLLAQIDWKNGQHTEAALLQMRHVEDYLKLKNYRPLQAVPAEFWSVSDEIELAIPQKNNMSGSVSPKKMEEEITAKTQLKNTVWRQRLIIALLALVVIALLWRKIFG